MHHAAIYYVAEGYIITGDKLMGRNSAGEGFLRAAAKSDATRLVCVAGAGNSEQHFASQLALHGFQGETYWIAKNAPAHIAAEGCLYVPGPGLGEFAWRRAPLGDRAYSLCGMTYTISSHGAMSCITELLTAPVRNWDALICISTVVRDTVRFLLERQAEFLRARLGATRFELPQLPVIPLGVHCDDFVFSEDQRGKARATLGIEADEVVVLFAGRLSFHAKAHPQQMLTSIERAAKGRRVRLIQCGKFFNPHIESAFKEGSNALCKSVRVDYLDGREAQNYQLAWASADIFVSLSDNIQESFGLTPVEAMAAGIPVVVSDWDGYKDTVRHGIDGFRIPTLMPPPPFGEELASRHETGEDTYDMYCGLASQLVALDPVALEAALDKLIGDSQLRKQMGAAGRQRARSQYDWSMIYRRYQTLWEELAERRRADPEFHPAPRIAYRPDRPDPFAAFATFPTTLLSDHHLVTQLGTLDELAMRRELKINSFAQTIQLDQADCATIFALLAEQQPRKVSELVAAFPAEKQVAVVRGLAWMAKMEAVRIVPPPANIAA